MRLDEINHKIVKYLNDGRRSLGEIARELSISTNTVRSRVTRLRNARVFDIVGVVDPDKLDGHYMVLVGVKLKTPNLVKKGEEFSRLRGVVSVAVVTGQFDLFLTVLLNNEFGLLDFYTQEVSKIEEVRSTETFVAYKNYNWNVPYCL